MKAVSRFGYIWLAGAIALAPAVAHAQQTAPASDAPATDAVGPKDLQNFSLSGTVTRAADQPTVAAPAPPRRQPRAQADVTPSPSETRASTRLSATNNAATAAPAPQVHRTETAAAESSAPVQHMDSVDAIRRPAPRPVATAVPKLEAENATTSVPVPTPAPAFAPDPVSPGTLGSEHRLPILPWLLAALALGAGGAFLFWRNRGRHAFAGGPQIDAFTAPEPPPAPAPKPVPRPTPAPPVTKAPPSAVGIVSTRLRPWIEIGFTPLRCILEEERLTVDFELELFNSGSAPARAVLVEATLFNAGPAQDREIGAFFANPVGEGERIVVIPPLKRIAVRTQVVTPRARLQAYELGGRQVFVPLIAFNALYQWSGGEGQTSVAYLLGRDGKGDKMGPFRLDLGPRIFRGIAGRLLPAGVRR